MSKITVAMGFLSQGVSQRNPFGLDHGVWVIDWAPPQAYNVSVVPCGR